MGRSVIFELVESATSRRSHSPGQGAITKKPTHRRRASALAVCLTWPQVALNRHEISCTLHYSSRRVKARQGWQLRTNCCCELRTKACGVRANCYCGSQTNCGLGD